MQTSIRLNLGITRKTHKKSQAFPLKTKFFNRGKNLNQYYTSTVSTYNKPAPIND